MSWELKTFPSCTHHVFLAYTSEDAELLARPLRDELMEHCGVATWLAEFDLPTQTTEIFADLRNALLRCRFIVYLLTERSLAHARGWQAIERGYGELLERSMRCGDLSQRIEFPLLFGCSRHPTLERSCWRDLVKSDRARVCPQEMLYEVQTQVRWAADQIVRFLGEQMRIGAQAEVLMQRDPAVGEFVTNRPGLADRIRCRYPES